MITRIIISFWLVVSTILNADTQKNISADCFFVYTAKCEEECSADKLCIRKLAGQKLYKSAEVEASEGKHAEAFKAFKFLADVPDLDYISITMSQWQVAEMYRKGNGVDKNIGSAIKYYEQSIKSGKKEPLWIELPNFKDSYLQLYFLYKESSPYKNIVLSRKNLVEAARQDYILAFVNLANDFLKGKEGFKQNDMIALALLYYELNLSSWGWLEETFGLEAKVSIQNTNNERINELTSKLSLSQIEESKKLSENKDKLFALVNKLSN